MRRKRSHDCSAEAGGRGGHESDLGGHDEVSSKDCRGWKKLKTIIESFSLTLRKCKKFSSRSHNFMEAHWNLEETWHFMARVGEPISTRVRWDFPCRNLVALQLWRRRDFSRRCRVYLRRVLAMVMTNYSAQINLAERQQLSRLVRPSRQLCSRSRCGSPPPSISPDQYDGQPF
jgi:hypothetical protein